MLTRLDTGKPVENANKVTDRLTAALHDARAETDSGAVCAYWNGSKWEYCSPMDRTTFNAISVFDDE